MTYKQVRGDTRRASYTYKPGLDRRQRFAEAVLAALVHADAHREDFAEVVRRRRRAEQDASAIDYRDKAPGIASTEHRLDRADARDLKFPDGSLVPLGARFTKTWEVHNIGQVAWIGRRLTRQTPQGPTFPSSPEWVPIADTFPGESVQLSVDFIAARVQGFTEVRFKMTDEYGVLFFPNKYPSGLTLLIETAGVQWIQRPTDIEP